MKRSELLSKAFSGHDRRLYRATGEFRPPKKAEFYLSGAVVHAYRAPNDLSTAYWIAVPVPRT